MSTYVEIVAQVADDLARTNIGSQIGAEVNAAIRYYDTKRAWFTEERTLTFSTVAAQEDYTSADNSYIDDLIRIDGMWSTLSNDKWRICPMDYVEREGLTPPNDSGRPVYYAYTSRTIRLWPVPDAVYTVRVLGWYRLAALVNDSDTNVWTEEAEDLIRHSARRRVQANVVRDYEGAAATKQLEDEAWSAIDRETILRSGSGIICPTDF
jgi:hypothetical protein